MTAYMKLLLRTLTAQRKYSPDSDKYSCIRNVVSNTDPAAKHIKTAKIVTSPHVKDMSY